MSNIIDSKVVEMEFDNKRFEENVSTSISTLDKLKKSLNLDGAAKGFDNLDKAAQNVDFTKMAHSLEFLEKRFSVMGIVGMRVIENLTDGVMRFVSNTLGAALNQIKTGGIKRAMSIENARFQLQGLISDQKEVNAIMQNALDSVDGTAYAYDAAALAASQFAASGMKSGDQMYGALRAITGVAAMTNSEYENISRIFTTVAGNGRLMGDQLLQLSSRGLNAASAITTYFNDVNKGTKKASAEVQNAIYDLTGGLQITEGQLRDLVSKGQISFAVFAEAMDQSFGEHAKKANDTLTGAFSNVKAALSRIGAEFIQPLVGQKSTIVQFLNTLRVQINGIKAAIIPMARVVSSAILHLAKIANDYLGRIDLSAPFRAMSESVWELGRSLLPIEILRKKDIESLKLSGKELDAFGKVLIATAKKHNVNVEGMIKEDQTWVDTLDQCWLTADIFRESLDNIGKTAEDTSKQTGKSLDEIRKTAKEVIRGDWGNGQARIDALKKAGFDPEVVQKYVDIIHELGNGTWNLSEANIKAADTEIDKLGILQKLSKEQLKSLGYTDKEIESIGKLNDANTESGQVAADLLAKMSDPLYKLKYLMISLRNVGVTIRHVFGAFKQAYQDVFGESTRDIVGEAIISFNKLTQRLIPSGRTITKITNVFRGLLSVIITIREVVWGIISSVIPPAFTILQSVAYLILTVASLVGDFIYKLRKGENDVDAIGGAFTVFGGSLQLIADTIAEVITKFADFIKGSKLINGVLDILATLIGGIWTVISKISNGLLKLLRPIRQHLSGFEPILRNIWTIISSLFDAIYRAASSIFGRIPIEEILEGIVVIIGAIGLTIGDTIASAVDGVSKFASELDKLNPEQVRDKFVKTFNNIRNYFQTGQFFKDIRQFFDNVVTRAIDFETEIGYALRDATTDISGFKDVLSGFWDAAKGYASKVNGGGIFAAIMGFFALKQLKNLPTTVKKIGKYLSGFNGILMASVDVVDNFAKIETAIKDVIANKAVAIKLDAIRSIILSIAALIVALAAFGYLAHKGVLSIKAIVGVMALIGILVGAILGISHFADYRAVAASAAVLVALGFALLQISIALSILTLASANASNYDRAILTMGGIIAAMIVLALALTKSQLSIGITGGKDSWKTMLAFFLGLAVALKIIVSAIVDLAKNDLEHSLKAFVMVIAIIGVMGLILYKVSKVSTFGLNTAGIGLAMVGMALSLLLLLEALKQVSAMDIRTIYLGIIKLIPLFAVLVALMVAVAEVGPKAAGIGFMILSIGIAVNLLIFAIKAMGALVREDPGALISGIIATTVLIIAIGFAVSAAFAASENAKKAAPMIVAMGIALALIAVAMKILSTIEVGKLIFVTVVLSMIMIELGTLISACAAIPKEAVGSITAVIIAIVAVVGSLVLLTFVDTGKVLGAAVSLGLVMLALSHLIKAIGKIEFKPGMIGTVILIGVLLFELGATLYILAGVKNPEALLPIAAGLSLLVVTMGAVVWALASTKIGPKEGLLAGLALDGFAAAFTGLLMLIGLLVDFNPGGVMDKVLSAVEFLGKLVGTFGRAMREASGAGNDVDKGPDIFDKIERITLLAPAIGAMAQAFGEIKPEGFTNLVKIAEAIKELAKAELFNNLAKFFTGGEGAENVTDSFSQKLPTLAKGLGEFYEEISKYNVEQGTVDSAVTMLNGLAKLSSTEIGTSTGKLSEIFGSVGGNMEAFGKNLKGLATGLGEFYKEAKDGGLDEKTAKSTITTATTLLSGLSDMAKGVGTEDGLVAAIVGSLSGNMKAFGDNLGGLATGLGTFYKNAKENGLNEDNAETIVNTAVTLLTGLTSSTSSIGSSGGFLDWLFGTAAKGVGEFAGTMGSLGEGIGKFYTALKNEGYDGDTKLVDNAVEVLKKLSEVDNDKGLLRLLYEPTTTGSGGFKDNVTEVGEGLSAFVTALGTNFDTSVVDKAVNTFSILGNLMNSDVFKNEYNASKFKTNVNIIADAFVGFHDKLIYWTEWEKIDSIEKFLTALKDILVAMNSIDPSAVDKIQLVLDKISELTIDQAVEVVQNGQLDVTNAVNELYDSLQTSIKDVPDLSSEIGTMVRNIANQVTANGEILGSVGNSLGAKLANGIKNGIKSAGAADGASSAMSSSLAAVNGQASQFSSAGKSAVSNLVSGIASGTPTVVATFKSAITSSLTTVKGQTGAFNSTGRDLVRGLTNGISADSYKVAAKAKAMAESAVRAARAALQVKSPSRVFYEIGEYVVQGFANALGDGVSDAYTSSYEMATSAKAGMTKALSNMSELIDANVDTSPVIRPVMDLSEIQSGVSAMDGMLATNPMLGVPDNLGAVNAMMMFRSKSATNDDVVSAINALKKNLGDTRGESVVINGITYDDGSNINDAVRALIRAARVERRA